MSFKNDGSIDKQVREALDKRVGGALKRGITSDYIELLKQRLIKRTQLGIGVDPNTGDAMKLPPLSDSYKEQRQGKVRYYTDKAGKKIRVTKSKNTTDYVKKPRLSGNTKPAKSNLTATGQLLNSLTVVKLKIKGGVSFMIRVADRRGRGLFDQPSTIGNKTLVSYLAGQGRHFLGFTNAQKNRVAREVRQIIRKLAN